MKLNEGAFFAICVVALTIICAGSISLEYWSSNQVRMTYQTSYQKNMECRSAVAKYGNLNGLQYVDKTCGDIPKLEDYQK
jgi:hypothetical protein